MMAPPKLSAAEFARLVAVESHRVLPLPEVAELTGFSQRWLERECRAERLEHTHEGHSRGMTLAQVDLLVASRRKGVTELASVTRLNDNAGLRSGATRSRRRKDVA